VRESNCDRCGCAVTVHGDGSFTTLRDNLAMAALTGLIACPDTDGSPETLTRDAYRYADAMLEARKLKEPAR